MTRALVMGRLPAAVCPTIHRGLWVLALSLVCIGWTACAASPKTTRRPSRLVRQPLAPADFEAHPSVRRFLTQSGLNLPWISYGHDVGWPRRVGTTELFGFRFYPHLVRRRARLPAAMKTVRVWMLADDRAGNLAGRDPKEFTVRCIRDLSAFMEDTGPQTRVIWVLYDFMLADGRGSTEGGHAGEHRHLVTTAQGARRALKLVLPCLSAIQARYGRRIVWDVFNEPLNGRCLTVTDDNQRGLESFLRLHMEALLKMGGRVSLGARNLQALRETWAGLWRHAADFARRLHLPPTRLLVQFHHYPGQELDPSSSLRTFHAEQLRRRLHLDPQTPIILGESWPLSGFTLADYAARGFAGALFWQDARLSLPKSEVRRQIEELRRLGTGRVSKGLGDVAASEPSSPPSSPPAFRSVSRSASEPSSRLPSRLPSSFSLDLSSCRIVTGPPATAWWRRLIGAQAGAFAGLSRRKDGTLALSVHARSRPPSREHLWWRQRRRTGFLLCDLPPRKGGWDLAGREISVSVTPPDPRLCGRGGCGMQVVVADRRGRTLHGPWSGLSAARPGRYELRFRPAPTAVPGIGFRQAGFDLHQVRSLGLLWSGATFASFSFVSRLLVHGIRIRPLRDTCSHRSFAPGLASFHSAGLASSHFAGSASSHFAGSASSHSAGSRIVHAPRARIAPKPAFRPGSLRPWCDACYQSLSVPAARIVRPKGPGLDLACRMKASDYPYFQGLSLEGSGQRISIHLDAGSAFARRGALWADLRRDCRVGGHDGILGALVDLRSSRIQFALHGSLKSPQAHGGGLAEIPVQVLLRDDAGRTCYVAAEWIARHVQAQGIGIVTQTDHPMLCAAGWANLSRIARIGLVFGPAPGKITGRLSHLSVTIGSAEPEAR